MTIDQEKCVKCGACLSECTMDAIEWQDNNVIITDKCSDCYCPAADACPTEAITERIKQ